MTQVVGPGAVQDIDAEVKPTLEGASEFEYVEVFNPLPVDFAVRVAQDVPINVPTQIYKPTAMIQNENDVVKNYGVDLRNPDFKGRKHITNDMIIKAGQTLKLKGDQAQVAVRQLVNEIMQREGKRKFLADPTARKEVEEKVVRGRGSIQELLGNPLQSARAQASEAIQQSNEVSHEESFPSLKAAPSPGTGSTYTPTDKAAEPKRVGRPKKTDN